MMKIPRLTKLCQDKVYSLMCESNEKSLCHYLLDALFNATHLDLRSLYSVVKAYIGGKDCSGLLSSNLLKSICPYNLQTLGKPVEDIITQLQNHLFNRRHNNKLDHCLHQDKHHNRCTTETNCAETVKAKILSDIYCVIGRNDHSLKQGQVSDGRTVNKTFCDANFDTDVKREETGNESTTDIINVELKEKKCINVECIEVSKSLEAKRSMPENTYNFSQPPLGLVLFLLQHSSHCSRCATKIHCDRINDIHRTQQETPSVNAQYNKFQYCSLMYKLVSNSRNFISNFPKIRQQGINERTSHIRLCMRHLQDSIPSHKFHHFIDRILHNSRLVSKEQKKEIFPASNLHQASTEKYLLQRVREESVKPNNFISPKKRRYSITISSHRSPKLEDKHPFQLIRDIDESVTGSSVRSSGFDRNSQQTVIDHKITPVQQKTLVPYTEDIAETEVSRIKAAVRNCQEISIKQSNNTIMSQTDNLLSAVKLHKLETEKGTVAFPKRNIYSFEDPAGFFPCNAQMNITVNMVPNAAQVIPWHLFDRETMRLASFTHYPVTSVKPKDLLASSGFVYIGNGVNDRVKCYFCLVEKEAWQVGDDIDQIHMSLNPSCPMVNVQCHNNVASNSTSVNIDHTTNFSSSVPIAEASPITRSSNPDNIATSELGTDLSSPRNDSGRDEVDSITRNFSEIHFDAFRISELSPPHRDCLPTSLSTTSITASHTTRSANMQAHSISSQSRFQHGLLNSQSNNMPSMIHTTGEQMNNVSENNNINDSRNQHYGNAENIDISPSLNQVQQDIVHHPNINSQVYSIPVTQQNELQTETPRVTETTPGTIPATPDLSQTTPQLTYQLLGIFHEKPKHLEYAVLARRLQSFEGWPVEHPIPKEDLAKSGLYFAGYGDCCRCFFCGGGLRNWENEDSPIVEHARWFGKCSFIRQYAGQEFVSAVQYLGDRQESITLQDVAQHMQQSGQAVQNMFERMITEDAAVKPLIDAGYDVELVSRAAKSLREMGEILSADMILRKIREDVMGTSEFDVEATEGAQGGNLPEEDRLQALKEQNYTLRNNLMCKICMDKEVRIVFLPCGHLVSCHECSVALQDCPVCRRHIRATARANIH